MKAISFIILIGLILLTGCQQERLPEDRLEDAEIYFFGQQDAESMLLIAGEDSMYNYTSNPENTHEVFELTSTLGHLKRPKDKRYLEVIIWDDQTTESSGDHADRFKNGERSLLFQSEYIESHHFRMIPNFNEVGVDEFQWDLGSFGKSEDLHPQPELAAQGAEWICLKATTLRGDSIATCKMVSVSDPELYSTSVRVIEKTAEYISVSADVIGVSADEWIWNGEKTEQNEYRINKAESNFDRLHNVKVVNNGSILMDFDFILDTNNNEMNISYLDFSAMQEGVSYADVDQTGKIIVNYFTPGSGLFSSRFLRTGSNSSFFIDDNKYFRQNEEGIPTHKIQFRFDLPLISEMGDTLQLKTTGSIMAFPNP